MPDPLAAELATYRKLQHTLLSDQGRYVVIAGEEVLGIYDTYNDALTQGYSRRKLEPFLVKQISNIDAVANFSRSLAPACRISA